jgi:hypothetical protein
MTTDVAAICADESRCPDCGLPHCVCFDDDDQPDEDDDLEDCMMGPDGYCGAAGSEYCDWECPLHNSHFGAALQQNDEGEGR